MTFKEWLNNQCKARAMRTEGCIVDRVKFPILKLNSGLQLSVQASEYHFCEPAETLNEEDSYESVEVYVGEQNVPELYAYVGNDECIRKYVPIEVMEKICENNGGITDGNN